MRVLPLVLVFGLLGACDHDPVDSDLTQMCVLPTGNAVGLPTGAPLSIYPNAQDTAISGVEPAFEITSDGTGDYHVAWTNPNGDAICFSGVVTTNAALGPSIAPDDAQEEVQFNSTNQIGFASIEATALEGFGFSAGTQTVNLEVYVDGAAGTYIFYSDDSTGLVTMTESNVAAFISP